MRVGIVGAGPFRSARCTEPLGPLAVQLAHARGFGPRIGAALPRAGADT